MKKIIFYTAGFLVVVVVCLYIGLSKPEAPQTPDTAGQPHTDRVLPPVQTPAQVPIDNNTDPSVTSDESNIEVVDTTTTGENESADTSEQEKISDWRTDDVPIVEHKERDVFTDTLMAEQAKADGSWIGDPEKMDPDELHSAIYQQLLNRFGDIPQVHTMMEFERKKKKNIQMNLDERIEGQKATLYIFPNDTNRKTLAFLEWMRSKGPTYKDGTDITLSDIEHLRSIGITVETKEVGDGRLSIKFSTK